jgi:hypothetical protein
MKMLRNNFRAVATPGSPSTTSTEAPSGSRSSAKRSAPGPHAITGVRMPARATGARIATST